jgi:NADPH-dependent stearoyl-CoA 9-desaturase
VIHEMSTRPPGREELRRRLQPFLRKAARQVFKDYVLFPTLALGNAPRVLVGNLAANLVRNVWSHLVIFCGHFPDGVRTNQRSRK